MGILNYFRRRKHRTQDRVTFTGNSVTHIRADDVEETIRWDDLDEVCILTTDEGPWAEDVYFLLIASDRKSGCAVPQSSDGCELLLKRLQQLPGFDNEALIQAMSSTSNARFVCWKRPVAEQSLS